MTKINQLSIKLTSTKYAKATLMKCVHTPKMSHRVQLVKPNKPLTLLQNQDSILSSKGDFQSAVKFEKMDGGHRGDRSTEDKYNMHNPKPPGSRRQVSDT